jgi:hypothetical protein
MGCDSWIYEMHTFKSEEIRRKLEAERSHDGNAQQPLSSAEGTPCRLETWREHGNKRASSLYLVMISDLFPS